MPLRQWPTDRDFSRTGRASYQDENGCKYDGEWQYTVASGKGTVFIGEKDGRETLKGTFDKSTIHGYGTYDGPLGKYEGQWIQGTIQGYGIMRWKRGDTYKGEWVAGKMQGVGSYKCENGDVIEGCWNKGKLDGPAVYQYASGDFYVGQFVDGRREGIGRRAYVSGIVYDGAWLQNKRNGIGLIYDKEVKDVAPECAVWEFNVRRKAGNRADFTNIRDQFTSLADSSVMSFTTLRDPLLLNRKEVQVETEHTKGGKAVVTPSACIQGHITKMKKGMKILRSMATEDGGLLV
eukprot:GFYU01018491.1.p1 GENE.GFYU01018491.1~~GFYU01018491.1.p1  ORF type:complete len:291 (-),score=49.35 GFYU01018491.1:29-901(-)